ncbi:hypothetical protein LWI28_008560 [Acer negundo]|uniref:Protein kinase domain-containing protein n=1 Tax=Acer negundo TaxID=4023 RepID=A0AAD5IDT2_ACENE|nr:hypothetical protein LWI28_008560 [Acer negundo]
MMEKRKYLFVEEVGAGVFGRVWKAVDRYSGEVVAIKKLIRQKFHSWINSRLYLVFEYMECNLLQVMRSRRKGRPFSEDEVRKWCFQVFQGFRFIHDKGYFHHDLKPENLLVLGDLIKIGDVGSTKKINSDPPHAFIIMSLWYRPPEVMLFSPNYSYHVDMQSNYGDLARGTCSGEGWNYQFSRFSGVHFSSLMPFASKNAISLIKSLCSWDPSKRPTASEASKHPFFKDCYNNMNIPPSLPDLNDNSMSVTTLDDDDQVPTNSNKILENPIGKSKYGPIGEEEEY